MDPPVVIRIRDSNKIEEEIKLEGKEAHTLDVNASSVICLVAEV